MSPLLLAVLVVLLAYVLQALFKFWKRISAIKKLAGPKYKFPYGTLYEHPTPVKHLQLIKKLSEENPKSGFRLWLGPTQAICIMNTPEAIRAVLDTKPPKAKMLYRYVEPWLGKHSLLVTEKAEWKNMRRLLTPAFHLHILKYYAPVVVEASEILIDKFLTHAAKSPEQDYDVFDDFQLMTLDVICRAAFSYEGNPQLNPEDKYSLSIQKIAEYIIARATNISHLFDVVYKNSKEGKEFQELLDYVHGHADKVIAKRAEELEGVSLDELGRQRAGGKRLLDFLDILLTARNEDGSGLSKEEIRHQCDTFLFAGHDTTSSALSWLSYNLSIHPEIQQKVRDEVLEQFGHDPPSYEDAQYKLPYLSAVIKESLRMFPPIPGTGRVLEEPITVNGVTLEPGTSVAVGIYALHHNPEVWENPSEFKPERFLNQDHDSMAFLPFSFGRRNCIGQNFALNEIRIAMCQLIRKVEILPALEKGYQPEPMSQIVLRSNNGVKMRFKAVE